jgi:uncharacterized membrane protein YeaQ/YmgE (transglycosylase-associated protein family)
MFEHIVQMGPMLFLAGLMVGMMAETMSPVGSYGLIPDMVAGIIGSVVGGGVVWMLVSRNAGMVGMFAIGCIGAGLAIVGRRYLWALHPTRDVRATVRST